METNEILAALKSRRSSLDAAIVALEGSRNGRRSTAITSARRGVRRQMSAAARKRLSMLLKKRWAAGKMGKRKAA